MRISGPRPVNYLKGAVDQRLFRENRAAAARAGAMNLLPQLGLQRDFVYDAFAALSSLAGLEIQPEMQIDFYPMLLKAGNPYQPLGLAFSGSFHQVKISIHQALVEPDPITALRREGCPKEIIRYIFRSFPRAIQDAIILEQRGSNEGLKFLLEAALTAELTHAVHFLLENHFGLPNATQEPQMGSPWLFPTRTRCVAGEMAEHLMLLMFENPETLARKDHWGLVCNPPDEKSINYHFYDLPWLSPNPNDFDFGYLFSKGLLGLTFQENAHNLAAELALGFEEKISHWYFTGLVRTPAQILAVLRLGMLYAFYAYPQREDVLADSEKAREIARVDCQLLAVNIAESLRGAECEGVKLASFNASHEPSPLKFWAIYCRNQLLKEMGMLQDRFRMLAGEREGAELERIIREVMTNDDSRVGIDLANALLEEHLTTLTAALGGIGEELGLIKTPSELARLVAQKIDRFRQRANSAGPLFAGQQAELERIKQAVASERFGSGRNLANETYARIYRRWQEWELDGRFYDECSADAKRAIGGTPWKQAGAAAARLNALPDENDVPSFPLTRL